MDISDLTIFCSGRIISLWNLNEVWNSGRYRHIGTYELPEEGSFIHHYNKEENVLVSLGSGKDSKHNQSIYFQVMSEGELKGTVRYKVAPMTNISGIHTHFSFGKLNIYLVSSLGMLRTFVDLAVIREQVECLQYITTPEVAVNSSKQVEEKERDSALFISPIQITTLPNAQNPTPSSEEEKEEIEYEKLSLPPPVEEISLGSLPPSRPPLSPSENEKELGTRETSHQIKETTHIPHTDTSPIPHEVILVQSDGDQEEEEVPILLPPPPYTHTPTPIDPNSNINILFQVLYIYIYIYM